MSETAKTRPTGEDVKAFIASVEHDGRRADALTLLPMFEDVTGWSARMWGPSIIGFGRYDYRYDSGHSGTAPVTGFSPRKANMVVYVMPGLDGYEDRLKRLGPFKTGKSCLYLGRLSGISLPELAGLIGAGVEAMKQKWPVTAG